MMKGFLFVAIGVILLSGCVSTRPFDQVEREMNDHPVRATFPVPEPCNYIAPLRDASALIGTWSVSGKTDGVDYSQFYVAPRRWQAPWDRSYTFSSDGTYSLSDTYNGRKISATGRWSYSNGLLVIDIADAKVNNHRELRLNWLDNNTFDLRWSSDTAEAAWWKEWVFDRGSYAGWDNSVVISYDCNGCRRKTSRMRKAETGVIYDTLDSPYRFRRSGGKAPMIDGGNPSGNTSQEPQTKRKGSRSSVSVDLDAIPL